MNGLLLLSGRVCIALIFIASGFFKIIDFEGTRAYMASAGMPATTWLGLGAIVLELTGGLALLLGLRTKLAASLLILFLLTATIFFHLDFATQTSQIGFLKNIAIIGGLLLVSAVGAGPASVDARMKKG